MKVSTLKRNPNNPQTYTNIGFSGIIDVCERLIFANNVTANFTAQGDAQQEHPAIVRGSVSVNRQRQPKRGLNNPPPNSDEMRGTKERKQENSKSFGVIEANLGLIDRERIAQRGVVVFQRKTNLPASRQSIENGGDKYLPVTIGLVKDVGSVEADYTRITLNRSHITRNYGMTSPTVERFANLAISKPILTGVRL